MGQFSVKIFFNENIYIELVGIEAIFSLFLTLKPDFGWVNCLSPVTHTTPHHTYYSLLTLNDSEVAGLESWGVPSLLLGM